MLMEMFIFQWTFWLLLMAFHKLACGLEGYDYPEVTCSQGLSQCSVMNEMPLNIPQSDAVDVKKLTAKVELRCGDNAACTICLLIDTQLYVQVEEDMDQHRHNQEANNSTVAAFVALCYKTPQTIPACKRVSFTVKRTTLLQNLVTVSLIISKPAGISFSSIVLVYSDESMQPIKVDVPSLNEVCSKKLTQHIEECHMPQVSSVINQEMNQVELKFAAINMRFPSMCIQYEANGICQIWTRKTIPLHSVAPCLCLQVWEDDERRPRRFRSCPFKNERFLHTSLLRHNVSTSVVYAQMNNRGQMLQWNVSAPCRLEGEVWPCRRTGRHSCIEIEGFRQLLNKTTWKQSNGRWVKMVVFENINLQLSPCVMMKVGSEADLPLGPFCHHNSAARRRWCLLLVALLLLVSLATLMLCYLHDFVKECVHIASRGVRTSPHVVLLSPPGVDKDVSEKVCDLGSLLKQQKLSVCVDQWSRREQHSLGPVVWLHSQLLHSKSRAVLILTPGALELAHESSRRHQEAEGDFGDVPLIPSPYSDAFTASLCLIHQDKQKGRVGHRFLLVTFDPSVVKRHARSAGLFEGLELLHIPSQTKTLIYELGKGKPRLDGD
ncbi:uncharacterized protein il17rc isoform X1 [Nerophis lumbriciformis]|uniref:uncharacterized protein il17rc isoform X1 n=1 Tax=Nerophis lumbriciformis TaxID=546530 RepID=UPI003BACB654